MKHLSIAPTLEETRTFVVKVLTIWDRPLPGDPSSDAAKANQHFEYVHKDGSICEHTTWYGPYDTETAARIQRNRVLRKVRDGHVYGGAYCNVTPTYHPLNMSAGDAL